MLSTATLHALDWDRVRDALSECARTPMGRASARELAPFKNLYQIHECLDAVDEVRLLEVDGGWIPVGAVTDIRESLVKASRGAVLAEEELLAVARSARALVDLHAFVLNSEAHTPKLEELVEAVDLRQDIVDQLTYAFDDSGSLSERAYPELGSLRERIHELHARVRSTLEELIKGDSPLTDVLQDRFVTQRSDRYVIPVKVHAKRQNIGIVHGTSASGQTAFIEPHQVIALNNALRIAESELDAAVRRILAQLSRAVGAIAEDAQRGVEVARIIDLYCARAVLGDRMQAVRPEVEDKAVVMLENARHPVLVLRDIDVVPNDLQLGVEHQGLIVSGPNTGGKTVALKTIGLCALLVSHGCHIPASEGSRVDFFPEVQAIVGDHQTVEGDHSSFSAHLVVLQDMVQHARPGSLYLIDEIASGTDPHQGAALAQAMLEHMVESGARVVVTTHFSRLKSLGSTDPRFGIAAMQFANGRPTWKIAPGMRGESHALDIASRIGVHTRLIDRAKAVMDEGERSFAETLAALEQATERADRSAADAESLRKELKAQRDRLRAKEERLERRARQIEEEKAAEFLAKLKQHEDRVRKTIAELQAAPSHKRVAHAREQIEHARATVPKKAAPKVEVPQGLQVGDMVRHIRSGQSGVVEKIKGKNVEFRVGTLRMRAKVTDLERSSIRQAKREHAIPQKIKSAKPKPVSLDDALRVPANTLDLRGQRYDQAIANSEQFFDRAVRDGFQVVFILHGHGTGALKSGIRKWLPTCGYVKKWRPANADQGGDAFTIAALA